MSDTVLIAAWLVGIPAAAALLAVLSFGAEWVIWQVETASARCQARFSRWRTQAAHSSHRDQDTKAFLAWLAAQTSGGPTGSGIDPRLIEAQKQSELIRALIEEEIPKTVMRCVETHRLTAKVTGAVHIFEIAYEPECAGLRAKAAWLLGHTVRMLEQYPLRLDDPRLLHNSIVLRKRALPTCRRCPYIQLAVAGAPRLCPTAELVQIRGPQHAAQP